MVRTIEVDGITVEIVVSDDCIDYDVYSATGAKAGSVGGCGYLPADGFRVEGVGGVDVEGRALRLVDGMTDPPVTTVRATFSDGTVLSDRPEGGLWLIIWIEDGPLTEDVPDILFEALDEDGNVVESAALPRPPESTVDTLHPEVETGH